MAESWTAHAKRVIRHHGGIVDRDGAEQLVLDLEDDGGHETTLKSWRIDGARAAMVKLGKKAKTVVAMKRGRNVELPATLGVETKSACQQSFWLHVGRDLYLRAIKRWRINHDRAKKHLETHEQIAEMLRENPHAQTPAEACDTCGIDVWTVEGPEGLAL